VIKNNPFTSSYLSISRLIFQICGKVNLFLNIKKNIKKNEIFFMYFYRNQYKFFINFNILKIFFSNIDRVNYVKKKTLFQILDNLNIRNNKLEYLGVLKKKYMVNRKKKFYSEFLIDFAFTRFYKRLFFKKSSRFLFSKNSKFKLKSKFLKLKFSFWKKTKLLRSKNQLDTLLKNLLTREYLFLSRNFSIHELAYLYN